MFDHVTIRVYDVEASRAFYELALGELGFGEPYRGPHFFEWEDFSISTARDDKPLTRNLHLAFVARSREAVDEWWAAMTAAGHRDDGAPGLRSEYHEHYYGAFVRDPDGNSVEAVFHGWQREGDNRIDHLWVRVRELTEARRFYETIAPVLGLTITSSHPQRFHVRARDRALALVSGEPVTENVHIAFPASDNAGVVDFHRIATEAGYRDNGGPGERRYHPGYYGAFVLDPDGNNIEAVCHNREEAG